jgi:hypothetical protein
MGRPGSYRVSIWTRTADLLEVNVLRLTRELGISSHIFFTKGTGNTARPLSNLCHDQGDSGGLIRRTTCRAGDRNGVVSRRSAVGIGARAGASGGTA